jgi:hypothetical protein
MATDMMAIEEDNMTYKEPNIDIDLSIIPGEDIEITLRKMEAAGRLQVARDIAKLKAMGLPIHYMIGETLIREEADGRKFEYRLDEDGNEEILDEIH